MRTYSLLRHSVDGVRKWLSSSISNRITSYSLFLTMIAALTIGSISYRVVYVLIAKNITAGLESQLGTVEQRLVSDLNGISRNLEDLARNSFIANGLVDSFGRDTYLLPFLREHRMPVDTPVTLVLCDFKGMPIASNRQAGPFIVKGKSGIRKSLSDGRSQAVVVREGNEIFLVASVPVIFPPTGMTEGVIVGIVSLHDVFADNIRFVSEHYGAALLVDGSPAMDTRGDGDAGLFTVRRTPVFAGLFSQIPIEILLSSKGPDTLAPLRQVAVIYSLIGAATLFIIFALSRAVARRLTGPLTALSRAVGEITASGSLKTPMPVTGADEVGTLAAAFNNMIDKLRESHERLETKVEERTRELRESEERFRSLFEKVQVTALVIDPESGSIIDCNAAAAAFYGWQVEELRGKNIFEINALSPEQAKYEMEMARREERSLFQFKHRRADGSLRDVEVYSGPIQTAGRTVLYSIIHDITDRRKAEQRLADAMNYIETLVEASPIGIMTYRLSGEAVSANTAAATIVGTSVEQLKRQNFRELASWKKSGLLDAAKKALETNQEQTIELPHTTTFGKNIMLAGHFVPFTFGGEPHLLLISQDITERKKTEAALRESEQLFRESIEFMPIPIGIANGDGTIRHYNKSFTETYGYTAADVPTIEDWLRTAYADTAYRERCRHVWSEDVQKAVRERGSTPTREYEVTCKNGRVKNVEITMRPIGSLFIATFYDVTARRHVEKDLLEKTLQLEDLTRDLERRVQQEVELRRTNEQMLVQQSKMAAMGEMLGAIAHQWRQPLNILGLIIQNLKDAHAFGELNQENIELTVQKSMSQIRHMSKTIDDFRTFFQPDKERSVFDTMQATGEVLSLFAAQLSANNIDFQLTCRTHDKSFTRLEDIVPCQEKSVNGFRNEFEHVIMNLINNAREAIIERRERGGLQMQERGRIWFEFRNTDGKIVIEVNDNGGGIPENVINRIFEPYFTTKDPAKGTGLGLYMSTVIIEEHMQGRLTAENRGQGTAFTIELPQA